jgi:hypothetical protein
MLLAKLSSILKGSQGTLALLIAGRLIELFRPPLSRRGEGAFYFRFDHSLTSFPSEWA